MFEGLVTNVSSNWGHNEATKFSPISRKKMLKLTKKIDFLTAHFEFAQKIHLRAATVHEVSLKIIA